MKCSFIMHVNDQQEQRDKPKNLRHNLSEAENSKYPGRLRSMIHFRDLLLASAQCFI